MDGGLDYLKQVIIKDSLGHRRAARGGHGRLVETYQDEWARSRQRRAAAEFRHFVNGDQPDPGLAYDRERGQRQPARPRLPLVEVS